MSRKIEEVIRALMAAAEDKNAHVRSTSTKALLKRPLPAVLQHYLRSSISFFRGVNKKYAQAVATLLLQSGHLLYDLPQKQLILFDG